MNHFSTKTQRLFNAFKPPGAILKRLRQLFLFALAALFVSLPTLTQVNAAASDLDLTFGYGGKVFTPLPYNQASAFAIALQPDGKIVVGGRSKGREGEYDSALVRYNFDGSLDASFGSGGKVISILSASDDEIYAIAIQPDGKIVTAGEGFFAFIVARFNADGSRDRSFGGAGQVRPTRGISSARAVAVQADGKIVVAGWGWGPIIGNDDFILVRLNPDGSPDSSFGTNGVVSTDFNKVDQVYSMAIQSDGRIVLGGTTQIQSGVKSFFALARYNVDGTPDNSFGVNGKVTTEFFSFSGISSLALGQGNKIVAAGYTTIGHFLLRDFALARYHSDGSLDSTFDFDGLVTTDFSGNRDEIKDIAMQADGRIVAAGVSYQTSSDFVVLRYNQNGSLDNTFGLNGRIDTDFFGTNDFAATLVIQPQGEIVVAGSADSSVFALARYKGDDFSFDSCLQDHNSGASLKFSSLTGEYQFTQCGGLTVGGTGTVTNRGCTITLQHNTADRRIMAKLDTCQQKGTASVQLFSPNVTFPIADRNTTTNTCSCP